jgi:hypothetical protein
MIIKQDRGTFELARKFAGNSQLADVRLASCRVWSRRDWRGESVKSQVSFKLSPPAITPDAVFLPIQFTVRMIDDTVEPPASSDVFGAECELEGRYSVRPGYEPTSEEIVAFQEANAVYHCWPFFREFAQGTSVRTGFPPIPIPLLTLSVESPQSEKPTEKSAKRTKALKKS